MRKNVTKCMSLALAAAMVVTVGGVSMAAKAEDTTTTTDTTVTDATTEAAITYNAYLQFQTDNWLFRNQCTDAQTGVGATKLSLTAGDFDYDYNTQFAGADYGVGTGNFVNAVITENDVQYTISMSGVDLKTLGATEYNMLGISTDIPLSMEGVEFKDVTVKVDGVEVGKTATGTVKNDAKDCYWIMLYNKYDSNFTPVVDATAVPTDSVEITFTMSGVNFDAVIDTPQEDVPGPYEGTEFSKGGFNYYVDAQAMSTSKAGKVSVTGVTKKNKSKTALTVPNTVKVDGYTYKVTNIDANAFANCKKLKSVTVGKNVKTIKNNAFKNCVKLNKLTFNGKLSSVGKNAFKGCKKTIKVAGKNVAANKKVLKKTAYKKFK